MASHMDRTGGGNMKIALYALRAFGGLAVLIGLGFGLGGLLLRSYAERKLR